jgi:hypothetical protein
MGLSMEEAQRFVDGYNSRRERFPSEPSNTSMFVMLFNFGDHLTPVRCIKGEWAGTKGELAPRDGIPVCPDGHPLLESGEVHRLALVAERVGP